MSIRDKILLSIVTSLSFFIILIYLCLSNIILNNCHQIEVKNISNDIHSHKNSPIVGSLLLGRYLTAEHIQDLETRLSMKINIDEFVQDKTDNNYLDKLAEIEKHQDKQDLPALIDVMDKNNLAAYTLIKDIESKPVSILKVEQSREIYQTGEISLRYFLISLVILWLFFSYLTILLDNLIITRLIYISKMLKLINVNNVERRLKVSGNDELAFLSQSINYLYGHPMGDDCLIKIASLLNNLSLFPQGLAARYGGEEFGIILPNTGYQNAIEVAKKVQQQVKQAEIVHESSSLACKYITISIGIATVIPRQGLSIRCLIETADEQLYHSKHQGRDRISVNLLSNLK
jgi:diguanylate cyclase (GGDEF)-like protein